MAALAACCAVIWGRIAHRFGVTRRAFYGVLCRPAATILRVRQSNVLMCRRFLLTRPTSAGFKDGVICTILTW